MQFKIIWMSQEWEPAEEVLERWVLSGWTVVSIGWGDGEIRSILLAQQR